jgi:hypothetical protein
MNATTLGFDAAGQERSDRHIAHHLHRDRSFQPRAYGVDPIPIAARAVDNLR